MNWYRLLTAQIAPEQPNGPLEPEQSQPTSAPEPTDAMLTTVLNDALSGRNIMPLANGEGGIKVAGATGHYRHKFFFDAFRALPNDIKNYARQNFKKMVANPQQVGLKQMADLKSGKYPIYSAQVGRSYRALAVKVGSSFIWYWIGTHEAYNRVRTLAAPAITAPPQPAPATDSKSQTPRPQLPQKTR